MLVHKQGCVVRLCLYINGLVGKHVFGPNLTEWAIFSENQNPRRSDSEPEPEKSDPNSGSKPRYPKLLRVIRVPELPEKSKQQASCYRHKLTEAANELGLMKSLKKAYESAPA